MPLVVPGDIYRPWLRLVADPHADPLAGLKEATSLGLLIPYRHGCFEGRGLPRLHAPREHRLQVDFRLVENRHRTREAAAAALIVAALGIGLTSASEPAVSVAAGTAV